jgi:hypothetical protein
MLMGGCGDTKIIEMESGSKTLLIGATSELYL